MFLWQQDGGADGHGADEAAAEPEGGAGAPDAPRHRGAPPRQTGGHRTHQGNPLASSASASVSLLCIIKHSFVGQQTGVAAAVLRLSRGAH